MCPCTHTVFQTEPPHRLRLWNHGFNALLLQTETFDAEMEGLASNVKKKGKLPARHGHLEESISRHKQHIVRLEQMLRLLDNEVGHHRALRGACGSAPLPVHAPRPRS